MQDHEDLRLPEYVLGALPEAAHAQVAAHVAGCGHCRAEESALREALGLLPLGLPPEPPPPGLFAELLRATRLGPLAAFAGRLARFFDITRQAVGDLLARAADPAAWVRPFPGNASELLFVQTGPSLAGADAGLVRLPPGTRFPAHRHVGDERGLILQGAYEDSDGRIYRAGDESALPAGSTHDFVALPGEDLIFAATVLGGIELAGGVRLDPDKPTDPPPQ